MLKKHIDFWFPVCYEEEDKMQITFFITRLSEEEIDKKLFEEGIHLSDIDAKALVGLFLDNRFHG